MAVTLVMFIVSPPAHADEVRWGPYRVTANATAATTSSCDGSFYGKLQRLQERKYGLAPLRCTQNFPYGNDPAVGVNFYYPTSSPGGKLPLVVFVPGFTGNPGYFDETARHWASYGFVVAVAFDMINLTTESQLLGISAAYRQDEDVHSPLHGRIDLRRIVVAGHSAGGGTVLQAAALAPAIQRVTGGEARIVGALAIAPAPLALGSAVAVPTFILTGEQDEAVPPNGPIHTQIYNRITAPAWFGIANNASHLASIDALKNNPFVEPEVSWIRFITGDTSQCPEFVGSESGKNPAGWNKGAFRALVGFERNAAAARASCPIVR